MAAKITRGVAGIFIVLLGVLFVAGGSSTREPNLYMIWLGIIVLGAVMLGGIVSAGYDVAEGIREKTLRGDSLLTLLVLSAGAFWMVSLLMYRLIPVE